MPLAAGTRLGPYEILAPLGAGGMGEVYRARDTRLGREIALKVLPDDVAADASRRQRFEQEARAASALNHPNILSIYDFGTETGMVYMVSELVEGESLRGVIERGPVNTRRLLDIAVQMADGLSAAHAGAIVHRDLKPENLMLTRDGRVKILDFGLAKHSAHAPRRDSEETVTELRTQAGVILGTIAYMSPEQARGETVDFRSDQFSFGVILYELLTCTQAFQRKTPAETVAAILRDEAPSLSLSSTAAPPPLRWIVDRCLAKDPAERYSHTTDLYRELRSLRDHLSEAVSQTPTRPETPVSSPRARHRLGILVPLVTLAIGFLTALLLIPPDIGMEDHRFIPFAAEEGYKTGAVFSPDGKTIAYSATVNGIFQIFTRSLGSATPVQITRSAVSCNEPFWSPDGRRIYYTASTPTRSLWSVGVAGGAAAQVLPDVYRAAISPDSRNLAFLRLESMDATTIRLGLWLSSPPGAAPRKFDPPPIGGMRYYGGALQFSPDGKTLGFWMQMWDGKPEFWMIPFPTGTPSQPFLSWRERVPMDMFRWMPDSRHILFPYHESHDSGTHLWVADSSSGSLQQVTGGQGNESNPAVAPDGRSIAYTANEIQHDLVEIALESGGIRNLIATSRTEMGVEWSPSGREFAYVTERSGPPEIWLSENQGGRSWPIVTQKDFGDDTDMVFGAPMFSPDGQRIAYARRGAVRGKSGAIWISPVGGGTPVRAVEESEENPQMSPSWSPDGNSIAFLISRSGILGLAKAAVGGGARPEILKDKVIVGTVAWSPKGDRILYSMPDSLSLIGADGKGDRVLNKRKWPLYIWSKDGARVYAIRSEKRRYQVCSIELESGTERILSEFDLPPGSRLTGELSVSPDGKSLATTLQRTSGDIWLLRNFHTPGGLLHRLWRW
jgi:eukaryotic-like serine/threonine-protein kinase